MMKKRMRRPKNALEVEGISQVALAHIKDLAFQVISEISKPPSSLISCGLLQNPILWKGFWSQKDFHSNPDWTTVIIVIMTLTFMEHVLFPRLCAKHCIYTISFNPG